MNVLNVTLYLDAFILVYVIGMKRKKLILRLLAWYKNS